MTRNEILNSILSEMRYSKFNEEEELKLLDKDILNNLTLISFVSSGVGYAVEQLKEDPTCGPRMCALIGHELIMLGYRLAKAEMEIKELEMRK